MTTNDYLRIEKDRDNKREQLNRIAFLEGLVKLKNEKIASLYSQLDRKNEALELANANK